MKKTYAQKKRTYRKKKYVKKKRTARKALNVGANSVIAYKLKTDAQAVVVPPSPTGTGNHAHEEYSPSLSELDTNEFNAFAEIYDEFKITGFRVTLKPRGNINQPGSTGANQGFNYYSVIDYTDTVPLASIDKALEYANCKVHKSWKTFSRYVSCKVPKIIYDVNNNPTLKTESPAWMQIEDQTIMGINISNKIVAHLGLKLFFEYNLNTYDVIFDEYITLYVKFRNKK